MKAGYIEFWLAISLHKMWRSVDIRSRSWPFCSRNIYRIPPASKHERLSRQDGIKSASLRPESYREGNSVPGCLEHSNFCATTL